MVRLIELYNHNKETIRTELKKANTPEESIKIVKEYLSKLTDVKGDYISGLTRPQAIIALDTIGLFQYTYEKAVLSISRPTVSSSTTINCEEQSGNSSAVLPFDTLAGIGVSSLIGVMLSNPVTGIPVAVVAGIGAAAVTREVTSKKLKNGQTETQSVSSPLEYPNLEESLVSNFLEELFITVDSLVDEYGKLEEATRKHPDENKLEDHQKVLEFIQDLLGWYIRKREVIPDEALLPLKMHLEDNLPDLLSEYNIKIRYYDPKSINQDATFFDFENEVGTQKLRSPLMIRPALLKGEKLLIKGRVIEPNTSTVQGNLPDRD